MQLINQGLTIKTSGIALPTSQKIPIFKFFDGDEVEKVPDDGGIDPDEAECDKLKALLSSSI